MGGNSHNGVKRQRKKASITKCPYTVPGLDKFHVSTNYSFKVKRINYSNFNHHHHVPEGLGVFSVPWSSKWSRSLRLFLGHPTFLRPFGLYRNACFGILFVSILCMCCSHFFWHCFISSTMFCAPVFSLIHWFFSLSNFVIPSTCLKNFICAASKCCSSLFFSTHDHIQHRNKINGNVWELHTEGKNCDKRQYYWTGNRF